MQGYFEWTENRCLEQIGGVKEKQEVIDTRSEQQYLRSARFVASIGLLRSTYPEKNCLKIIKPKYFNFFQNNSARRSSQRGGETERNPLLQDLPWLGPHHDPGGSHQ